MTRKSLIFAFGTMMTLIVSGTITRAAQPTLDDILENYAEAVGGAEAWERISSLRQTGFVEGGPSALRVVISLKRPEKIRVDFEVDHQKGTQAFDGTTAWMFMPYAGQTEAVELSEDQSRGLRRQADLDGPLLGAAGKGVSRRLVGDDQVAGKAVWVIESSGPDGLQDTIFLDKSSFLPIRISSSILMMGRKVTITNDYSDYRIVGPVKMPYRVETSISGDQAIQILTLERIEIDPKLVDSIFSKPAS